MIGHPPPIRNSQLSKNHLTEHNANLSFDDMTENGLNDLVDFLRNVKNMQNSTIGKQLGYLKWFLKWAFQKKHFAAPTYMGSQTSPG